MFSLKCYIILKRMNFGEKWLKHFVMEGQFYESSKIRRRENVIFFFLLLNIWIYYIKIKSILKIWTILNSKTSPLSEWTYTCVSVVGWLVGWLVGWCLWHINLCGIFNAKSILHIYVYHQVTLLAQIPLTLSLSLSPHPSKSSILTGRSSTRHPVSAKTYCCW